MAGVHLASAAEVVRLEVVEQDGEYRAEIEAYLAAPLLAVWSRLGDYTRFDRISPSIIESEVVTQLDEDSVRVRTLAEACILYFCKTLRQVQTVQRWPQYLMTASVDPAESDFKVGHALWRLDPAGDGTRLRFKAMMRPAFWVPPLIGPWSIKRGLSDEMTQSIRNLERLSGGRRQ